MNSDEIRKKMDELNSKLPFYYTGKDRKDFTTFVYEEDLWVDSGPFWLSAEHEEGTRLFRPALTYLTDDDYQYFKEKIDDDHIDKARLARNYVESIMALCGYLNTSWGDWALRRIGNPAELLQALQERPVQDIAAEAIRVLVAKRNELVTRPESRRDVEVNPFGDWSYVKTRSGNFSLKPAAAKCFAVMIDLEDRGLPLHKPYILKKAELSEDRRLDHVFGDSGAWGGLVRTSSNNRRWLEIVWGDDKTDDSGDGKDDG